MSGESTLYLVDDDASVRRGLTRLLSGEGYRIVSCDSAKALLELAPFQRPSCLLVDIRMPGTTGLDLQRALRHGHHPPMVMLSGHADAVTSARAMSAGAIAVLSKPVDLESLVTAVELGLDQDRRALGIS